MSATGGGWQTILLRHVGRNLEKWGEGRGKQHKEEIATGHNGFPLLVCPLLSFSENRVSLCILCCLGTHNAVQAASGWDYRCETSCPAGRNFDKLNKAPKPTSESVDASLKNSA